MSLGGVQVVARCLAGVARILSDAGSVDQKRSDRGGPSYRDSKLDSAAATDAAHCLLLAGAWIGPDATPSTWSALRTALGQSVPVRLSDRLLDTIEVLPESCLQCVLGLQLSVDLVSQLSLTCAIEKFTERDSSGHERTCFVAVESSLRRRSGAHYTPRPLARLTVERTLGPLVAGATANQLTALRVCDPALGAGIFLEEAGLFISDQLARVAGIDAEQARRRVFANCLYGIDKSRPAVILTQLLLWRAARTPDVDGELAAALERHLVCDDALRSQLAPSVNPKPDDQPAFSSETGGDAPFFGFDAVLGNPPWVAFVGRAAQPLPKTTARDLAARFSSFKKYRTLHGLFIERATHLVRIGGRIGLVLPTSVADLDGYAPTRAAHDALSVPESSLPNFGDRVFEGVFQPSMVLLSERTRGGRARPGTEWSLERHDLAPDGLELLARLAAEPTCPPHLFGERGYQTDKADRLVFAPQAPDEHHVALRTGSEVTEYAVLAPRCYGDPRALSSRLRPPQEWVAVKLLIRQTARYPIVAAADDQAFRNSVLAGFEDPSFSWQLLLAYLNSTPVRWFHYQSRRDARQGMPQTKVSHLRGLPCPPALSDALGQELHAWGARLGMRNAGIHPEERRTVDELVGAAWKLTSEQLEQIWAWGRLNEPPRSRRPANPARDTLSSDARAEG